MVPSGLEGQGHCVSLAQETVFHNTDNCTILCSESCRVFVVAAIGVRVLSGAAR